MSETRATGADPAPPRHPQSRVEPHAEAAAPSTHLDQVVSNPTEAVAEPEEAAIACEMMMHAASNEVHLVEVTEDVQRQREDHVASPEVVDQQLEHAGPIVNEFLVQHQPDTLHSASSSTADPNVTTADRGAAEGLGVPPSHAVDDHQSLLGPPSPNLYGEPTPPGRTIELPVSPLLSPDFDPPAPPPLPQTANPSLPTSPRSLQIRTHPADLAPSKQDSTPIGPASGSVPSTPISPSGGDAGHDGAEEEHHEDDEEEEDERPLWSQARAAGLPSATEATTAGGPDLGHDDASAQLSPVLDAVEEQLDPPRAFPAQAGAGRAVAYGNGSARPMSASQPPPFIAPAHFAEVSPSELPPTDPQSSAASRAQLHGRSHSVATPVAAPSPPPPPVSHGGAAFQSALASAMGPPPARRPSDRYRASSAAAAPGSGVGVGAPTSPTLPNGAGAATPRSTSSGAAPSSSLAREASLRSSASATAAGARAPSTGSHPPSRQASISTNGRSTGGTATDGHDPRDGSRRKAPGGGAGEQGIPASGQQQQTVVSGARSRRTLGEWQLTKTLGAGSMGKVKLGVSQVTGEKVRLVVCCARRLSAVRAKFATAHTRNGNAHRLRSRSFRASPRPPRRSVNPSRASKRNKPPPSLRTTRTLRVPRKGRNRPRRSSRKPPPRTRARRSGPSARAACACSCTIRTSAGCARCSSTP